LCTFEIPLLVQLIVQSSRNDLDKVIETFISTFSLLFQVPFLVGQTKDEGAFFYRLIMNSFNNGIYDDNLIDHKLPRILPVLSSFNSKLYPITRQVRKKYFVNVDMEDEDEFRPRFVDFLTDLMFTRCTDKFAKILANHSVPTYQYSFDYRGQYSIVNLQGEQVILSTKKIFFYTSHIPRIKLKTAYQTFMVQFDFMTHDRKTKNAFILLSRWTWAWLTATTCSTSSKASGARRIP
jgi:carboxylesterase type B